MNDKKLIISGKKFRGETSVVSVRLPNDMIEKLDEIAEETGRTRNEIVTKCLVFAIENGSNQLHPKLREDNRVISFDNTNARYIDRGFIPLCDVAVMDVSFISQTKLYGSVTNVLKPQGKFISLIKPQFEAGRDAIGKNGIVKDKSLYPSIIANIKETAKAFDLILLSTIESPILGGDGNTEYLACFTK